MHSAESSLLELSLWCEEAVDVTVRGTTQTCEGDTSFLFSSTSDQQDLHETIVDNLFLSASTRADVYTFTTDALGEVLPDGQFERDVSRMRLFLSYGGEWRSRATILFAQQKDVGVEITVRSHLRYNATSGWRLSMKSPW